MQGPVISSKKISLVSDYHHFDLLPMKKFNECNVRIPQTILLEKGYLKDWIFNSHKVNNHPILKKKRQNMTPFAVVKAFCQKLGYGNVLQGCTNIGDIRDQVKIVLKEQKDYDFVKDKKVIQVVTVTDEVLNMSLSDFLDYVSENKYSQQQFYEKWKIIQQKVSIAKIDEFYQVQNIRHNHVIQSKCQKIISVNTTQAHMVSTQIEGDPYKNVSPNKNFAVTETKNLEGYKFFDTFLNKKFFQLSGQIIQFIQKNLKCLVQSVNTKFVINKDREPYLYGIYGLCLKPAKKIAEMKDFKLAKEKGFIKVEEYSKFLEVYISENMEKYDNFNINTPIAERRKKCHGKFCKTNLTEIQLPPLMQQKLKLPSLSSNTRLVGIDLRDAVLQRKRRVMQKLMQNKIVQDDLNKFQDSSEYQSSAQNQQFNHTKTKNKQLKICQNCYILYFHINRFFQLDMYGNLVERKEVIHPIGKQKQINYQILPVLSRRANQTSPILKSQGNINDSTGAFEIKPITVQKSNQDRSYMRSKSNTKFEHMTKQRVIKQYSKQKSLSKNIRSQRKINGASLSKIKLDPLLATNKNSIIEQTQDKGNRLMNLTKLSQPIKLKQRQKASKQQMLTLKERRPQNHEQAIQQFLKKISFLGGNDTDELIVSAKNYYRNNLPQLIDRRSYSTYYHPHLYQFMNNSIITIHPKQRIKKRPEMSLKRLSELTDYPEIVSRSQFIFDTLIVNEQTTVPFCVITTKVVNPNNLRTGIPFENIFIINDIFDSFIEHISMAKQILEEDQVYNKRIIIMNYPGQSHTIYNQNYTQGYSAYFSEVIDKILYRLSHQSGQLKIIDLQNDLFKFIGFGYGGYLLATYIGHSHHYFSNISGIMIINSYMKMPKKYRQNLQNLLVLYSSDDPTVQSEAFLYYNKSINSEEISTQDLIHKSGLNPIRLEDRSFLLKGALRQIQESETQIDIIQPLEFQQFIGAQVSIIYGKKNSVIPKQSCHQFMTYRKNKKQSIPNRIFIQLDAGHDILADNYEDISRVITLFFRK